jgi:hypothetical protein
MPTIKVVDKSSLFSSTFWYQDYPSLPPSFHTRPFSASMFLYDPSHLLGTAYISGLTFCIPYLSVFVFFDL